MQRTQRDRLLDSIADTDSSGPTNPFVQGETDGAEAGVHSDMMKLTNPDAYVGAVADDEGPTLLPLDLNEG
jgi:hypothetical protein